MHIQKTDVSSKKTPVFFSFIKNPFIIFSSADLIKSKMLPQKALRELNLTCFYYYICENSFFISSL